jgi:hypothetical protein
LTDLGQTESPRRSIKQSNAKPLLQQRDAPTDARFGQAQCTGRGREAAMDNDGRKELEVVEIAHCLGHRVLTNFYDRIV